MKRPRGAPRVLYVGPNMGEAGLGLKLRDQANRTGVCPGCGAEAQIRQVRPRLLEATFEHESWCRATAGTEYDRATRTYLRKAAEEP